jgi:cytochrome c biogenesis protein CcdA
MLRLSFLIISIGLADSMNPSTIGPALYIAGGESARRRVAQFTLGVFLMYFVGGIAIALGPGQLVLSLVPKPGELARYILETIAGVTMLVAALVLWQHRLRLADKRIPTPNRRGRSSAMLGATITAVELPTAFPYFAAIAAIVGSGDDIAPQVILLLIFNVCFVMPLLGILLAVWIGGERATRWLTVGRDFLQARWPVVLAAVGLLAGVFALLLGVSGLLSIHHHGRLGRFFRHVHHILSHP